MPLQSASQKPEVVSPPKVGYPVDGIPGHLIKVAVMEPRTVPIGPEMTHVEVNPKGRFPWLQRWLLNWLDKLGAIKRPWRQEKTQLVVVERGSTYLMNQIVDAVNDIYDRYGSYPTVCYIGERALRDVMKLTYDQSSGGVDAMYWTEALHRGGRVINMRVNVVPWLDGMFFV